MLSNEQQRRVQYLTDLEYISDTGSPDDEDITRRRFEAALAEMGPQELHQYAGNYNCDSGVDGLRAVIRHPCCDRGTALMVFWRLGPGWYFQYPDADEVPGYERDWYDLLTEIQARYVAGSFEGSAIAVDPRNQDGQDLTQQYVVNGGVKRVAGEMFAPSPGRVLELLELG
jgi:hypothetical protein